jgi:site-specific recombinase XerD
MQIDLETQSEAVIALLEQADYSESTISSHRRCYDGIQAHFANIGSEFSMAEAVNWLTSRRPGWCYATYCGYRSALYRFERYLTNGTIARTMCWSDDDFACRDKVLALPEALYKVFADFTSSLPEKFCETSVHNYSQGCKDFLLFLAEQGINEPARLTLDPIITYSKRLYTGKRRLYGHKSAWLAGIVNLLTCLAERGDVPMCYASVLPRNTAEFKLLPLKLEEIGTAFQPSKMLEPLVSGYLSSLDEMCYNESSKHMYCHDFTNFFLFLELNHIDYSEDAVELWLEKQTSQAEVWERRRHTLTLFGYYLKTGTAVRGKVYSWRPLQIDGLPEWSRRIVLGFVAERRKEGLSEKTLIMCRSAGYRLFKFLDSKGVCSPSEITPELLKEFHNTDEHATPESKNAYGIKTRQLLMYMAEQQLAPQNLFLAVSVQCAPRRTIVQVMSDEMIAAVYNYRAKAAKPIELRDAAIVMLGLRTGLRSSDIANLRIDDFDFHSRTVSLVQQKTLKAITLPVPVDVVNSVYRYVMEGRPSSGTNGAGYVFVRHLAPFGRVTRQICRSALARIMSDAGLELPAGQAFHITRKTFATNLLRADNSLDSVSNALGHVLQETADVYVARDEDKMRLCPLPFESVGAV